MVSFVNNPDSACYGLVIDSERFAFHPKRTRFSLRQVMNLCLDASGGSVKSQFSYVSGHRVNQYGYCSTLYGSEGIMNLRMMRQLDNGFIRTNPLSSYPIIRRFIIPSDPYKAAQ